MSRKPRGKYILVEYALTTGERKEGTTSITLLWFGIVRLYLAKAFAT